MKTLQFTYEMRTKFEAPIWNHHYTLKCIPRDSERQKMEECRVEIDPEGICVYSMDSFQNRMVFGSIMEPHDHFSVTVSGRAVTGLSDREEIRDPGRLGSFLVQTARTAPGDSLKKYYESLSLNEKERPYDKALSIMENLEKDFRYCQGVTDIGTTAEEAWNLRRGVCQDFCHIMLSLCRMAGIPCRYIVGMLTGEGYSHAWVEIADQGFWYALDPTNHMAVSDGHIKISCGRDYHDSIVDKGIFRGSSGQQQSVRVSVIPEGQA